jgi:hypothetical protein
VGEHISGTVERVGRQCELPRDLNVHHPHTDKLDWSLLLSVMSIRIGGRHIRVWPVRSHLFQTALNVQQKMSSLVVDLYKPHHIFCLVFI